MLNKINTTDKHHVIPASVVFTSHIRMEIKTPSGVDTHLIAMMDAVCKDGAELTRFAWPDLNVDVDTKTTCAVAFAKIGDSENEPIVPFFTRAIVRVWETVEKFG